MTTEDGRVVGTTKVVDAGDPAAWWNLVVLGDAFNNNWTVSVDYNLDAGKQNGVAIRVALVK